MKLISLTIVVIVTVLIVSTSDAQDRVARNLPSSPQAAASSPSQAQAAIAQAAEANKFIFIYFWKEHNQQTDKAWAAFQPAMSKITDQADTVSVQTTDPAEKAVVDRFAVSRSPMPLVLAIAPCGAITKGFISSFDENQLRTAFVSPGTQKCMKALQDSKLAMVCVVDQAGQNDADAIPQGVRDFKADQRYGKATEIVVVNAGDQAEENFLKDLQVDAKSAKPVTVFFTPPGTMIGKFEAKATKQEIIAKLTSAQSSCCPGGKRGPNGCCPKK